MSSRPWYRFYPADFYGDTRLLTFVQRAIYREILDELWNGPFLANASAVAHLCGVSEEVAQDALDAIGDRLEGVSGKPLGWVDHPKMLKQRTEAVEKSEKARAAGQKGGKAKASKRLANATKNFSEREATRAGARSHPPAGPDPERFNTPTLSRFEVVNSRARAREGPGTGLTDDERAEAERLQHTLEQARQAAGVEPGGELQHVTRKAQKRVEE